MESIEVKRVINLLEADAERRIKKLVLDVAANLVEMTPVDTGWARANWVPSIGQSYIGGGDEFKTREERAANVGRARSAADAGTAAVLGYRLQMGAIYVTNNVPYIEDLNEGSSPQAPAGFVQIAIDKAVVMNGGV